MAQRPSLLLVDVGSESMQELSLRLRQMSLHVIRTKTTEQGLDALVDPRYAIAAAVIPPDLPALDLEQALQAFQEVCPEQSLPLLAYGRRPSADHRARMRRSGVEWALWLPLDDNTLRFQVNRSLAGGGPIVSSRRAARVPTNWPVRIQVGEREKPAKLYSVSARGAYLATSRPSLPRSRIDLSLPLPSGDLPLAAEVVMTNVPGNLLRRNLPIGMGVCFRDPSEEVQRSILSFTEQRAAWLRV